MTLFKCGKQYGEGHKNLIRAFCAQELSIIRRYNPACEKFLSKCMDVIDEQAPNALEFYRGMSKGSGIELHNLLLLSLHEEFYHMNFAELMTHCSLVISPNPKRVLLGQNWDWPCRYYPWTGITKLQFPRKLNIWTYHLPGLPIGNAMNSKGLALAWTGAGYFPLVKPKPGVPTYLILIELMLRPSVKKCLDYLDDCTIAGASILGLADRHGNSALVEALPGRYFLDNSKDLLFRANHYAREKSVKLSKQEEHSGLHSLGRVKAFEVAKEDYLPDSERCHSRHLKKLLSSEGVIVDLELKAMTHGSFVFEPMKKTVWYRSGGWDQGRKWKSVKICSF